MPPDMFAVYCRLKTPENAPWFLSARFDQDEEAAREYAIDLGKDSAVVEYKVFRLTPSPV